ncbi:MAG TPA: hypothetical protein DIC60_09215 [Lachnospiraceae bacterium]|nr:hypothetical protein [Lachnospiraceae bacterium]
MLKSLYIEFREHKVTEKKVIEAIKALWKSQGNLLKDLVKLDIYFKAEEGMCYYIINDVERGGFSLGSLEE